MKRNGRSTEAIMGFRCPLAIRNTRTHAWVSSFAEIDGKFVVQASRSIQDVSPYAELLKEALAEAKAIQQNFYELSADWNYYEEIEYEYLKLNIGYAIFGPPDIDQGDTTKDKPDPKSKDHDSSEEKPDAGPDPKPESGFTPEQKTEIIDSVYNRICEASRTKKSLHVGTIFNVLFGIGDNKQKYVSPIPVFKVKRCMQNDERSSQKRSLTLSQKVGYTALYSCCVYYVDIEGRIYQNWTDYVANNKLPNCEMVLPMGGFYQADPSAPNTVEKTHVWLEVLSSSKTKRILPILDIAGTVLGFGALGVGIAAMAVPVIAPVAIAGTVCGAASGLWTTGRSGHQLIDRRQHQQSINVMDESARSAWLGVAGGLAGGLASGSTQVLNRAVQAGFQVGTIGRATYNTIAVGNIIVNGTGIVNGIYGIIENYQKNKEFSVFAVGQVVAHILFFGNAVVNLQTARTIIDNTQQRVIQDYEASLRSNKHREAFRRIRRSTQSASGDTMIGDNEIIRGIKSIQNKADFFAGIVKNRKAFSASKAKVTFKDGYATINNDVRFDPMELSQQSMEVRINTVRAAAPLDKVGRSTLPWTTRMPVSAYNELKKFVKEKLENILGSPMLLVKMIHIGGVMIDLQSYLSDDRYTLIGNLARYAAYILEKYRSFITLEVDNIMNVVWFEHVRPALDKLLREMGIDASLMAESDELAKLVFDITQTIIDAMYDNVEHLLQIIIKYSERCDNDSQPSATSPLCSNCSGYVLSE